MISKFKIKFKPLTTVTRVIHIRILRQNLIYKMQNFTTVNCIISVKEK